MFNWGLKDRVEELERQLLALQSEQTSTAATLRKITHPKPTYVTLEVGDKVKGSPTCGFDRSMTGKVVFVEPSGTVWVLRDGASGPCMFARHELILT